MVLTSGTLENMDRNIGERMLLGMRASTGERFGLLPGRPFSAEGFFVKKRFEVPSLKCTALLPSGMMVDADEAVAIDMPKLGEGHYYFCIGIGEGKVEFENGGVPYERPGYDYSVLGPEELESRDVLPLARFSVSDGTCSIDPAFIPPCMLLSGSDKLIEAKDSLIGKLSGVLNHPHLEDGDGKSNLFRYFVHLRTLTPKSKTSALVQFSREIVAVVDYFIVAPNRGNNPVDIPEMTYHDVERWFSWTGEFLDSASSVLDGVELRKEGIDIEAIKKDIVDGLYERLKTDISESVKSELRPLQDEYTDARLNELLKGYVDGSIRRDMHDDIKGEVGEELGASLYDRLYKTLYDALYVPVETEENEYMPLI